MLILTKNLIKIQKHGQRWEEIKYIFGEFLEKLFRKRTRVLEEKRNMEERHSESEIIRKKAIDEENFHEYQKLKYLGNK